MSADAESESSDHMMMLCCASCGIAEDDDIKLKKCTACKLVRYCSVDCQKEHRPKHKQACKKRAAELRDEILFKQPESTHEGDCPICLLPLPMDPNKSVMMACCCKLICIGCESANKLRELEQSLKSTCPFCRHPLPKNDEEAYQNMKKRAEANDPVALRQMGKLCIEEGDNKSEFEYYTKAAELGDFEAHYELSVMYHEGQGVEKDKKRELHHLEEAAIGGHPDARHNLGCVEDENGRLDRAVKHWIIAANLGFDDSLDALKKNFRMGLLSKEVFAAALRAHHAAVDATKSPHREESASTQEAIKRITGGR